PGPLLGRNLLIALSVRCSVQLPERARDAAPVLPALMCRTFHERTAMDEFLDLLKAHAHVVSTILFTLLRLLLGWFLRAARHHRLKKDVAGGDIGELLAIEQILVKGPPDGRTTLRIRSLGSAPLGSVLTNPLAHSAFLRRTAKTKPTNTLIDMQD